MESLAVDLDGTDIRIHLVNPGIIDTELFRLPDNEPSLSDLEALPVEALTDAVLKQLDDDVFEIYVPDWFVDIVSGRYANIGPFIEGSRQYVRERIKQMEAAREFASGGTSKALDATGRIVRGIDPRHLEESTPCETFDVRGLLNHVVSGNLWVEPLVSGKTIDEVGDRYDGDVVGDDPSAHTTRPPKWRVTRSHGRARWRRRLRCPTDRFPARSTPVTDSSTY